MTENKELTGNRWVARNAVVMTFRMLISVQNSEKCSRNFVEFCIPKP